MLRIQGFLVLWISQKTSTFTNILILLSSFPASVMIPSHLCPLLGVLASSDWWTTLSRAHMVVSLEGVLYVLFCGGCAPCHFPQWIALHLGTLKISEVLDSELFFLQYPYLQRLPIPYPYYIYFFPLLPGSLVSSFIL